MVYELGKVKTDGMSCSSKDSLAVWNAIKNSEYGQKAMQNPEFVKFIKGREQAALIMGDPIKRDLYRTGSSSIFTLG